MLFQILLLFYWAHCPANIFICLAVCKHSMVFIRQNKSKPLPCKLFCFLILTIEKHHQNLGLHEANSSILTICKSLGRRTICKQRYIILYHMAPTPTPKMIALRLCLICNAIRKSFYRAWERPLLCMLFSILPILNVHVVSAWEMLSCQCDEVFMKLSNSSVKLLSVCSSLVLPRLSASSNHCDWK